MAAALPAHGFPMLLGSLSRPCSRLADSEGGISTPVSSPTDFSLSASRLEIPVPETVLSMYALVCTGS